LAAKCGVAGLRAFQESCLAAAAEFAASGSFAGDIVPEDNSAVTSA